jgi:hypothetical protein
VHSPGLVSVSDGSHKPNSHIASVSEHVSDTCGALSNVSPICSTTLFTVYSKTPQA